MRSNFVHFFCSNFMRVNSAYIVTFNYIKLLKVSSKLRFKMSSSKGKQIRLNSTYQRCQLDFTISKALFTTPHRTQEPPENQIRHNARKVNFQENHFCIGQLQILIILHAWITTLPPNSFWSDILLQFCSSFSSKIVFFICQNFV